MVFTGDTCFGEGVPAVEWLGLEETFKDHPVQPLCHRQAHLALTLDHVAQSPILPGLGQF